MKRLNVLMSAYSCEPGKGSELGVGWNVAREVARYHNVWVLVRPDESGDAIRAELERNPEPNLHFVFFTLPLWAGGWRWGMGAIHLHYYLWQIQAYFVARRLHQTIGFNVTHHVTFVRHSTPSFLSLLPVPFVWGPVGGGESAPKPFWQDFSLRAKVYEYARSVLRGIGEIDPFSRMTAQRSALARVTTEDTAVRVRQMGAPQVQVYPEAGLPKQDIEMLAQYALTEQTPVRFISMGRLLHWKGFYLGIRAFAAAKLPDAEYWLFGEGPDRSRLQQLAADLGVAHQVKFWNRQPREETLRRLGECLALVHPSLHDSGGWVCLEAMATGRPVLCLDLGGPGVQVTEATGFKIAAHTPEQAVADLAAAMQQLANDRALALKMGQAGQQRVREWFDWEVKGRSLAQLYETLLNPESEAVVVGSDDFSSTNLGRS